MSTLMVALVVVLAAFLLTGGATLTIATRRPRYIGRHRHPFA